jgi:Helix-turn-helix
MSIVDRLEDAPSGAVASEPLARTFKPHGVTGAEVKRFNGALHLMKKRVRVEGELWWLTTPKGSTRSEIAAIQKRITRLQGDHGLYCYSAWVFETKPALHAHIVFIGNPVIAAALKRSAVCRGCNVDLVSDPDGLAKNYLSKERTPQAGYGRSDLGGRIRGSHRIEGGGDRVRLSRELERDAIEAGLVKDWRHTNAKRSEERKERRLQRLYPKKAPRLSGQILLFPELEKPIARLHSFAQGYVPPAVAAEIEFRRKQRGMSQTQLAALMGRSQSQLAHALRGHDPISAVAVSRLRQILLALS